MTETRSLILASNSPRRAFLLKECGFEFEIRPTHASEDFDPEMDVAQVPALLATKKAEAALATLKQNELVLTADTVVIFENEILNKPQDEQEAIQMLSTLSGNTHKVITAVCLATTTGHELLEETSWVTFFDLKEADILNYVRDFKPFDKAGAYGAQECLPENYNPCSGFERHFLQTVNKPDLWVKSQPTPNGSLPMLAIQEIAGSYFNVMGLPIAQLYDMLKTAL